MTDFLKGIIFCVVIQLVLVGLFKICVATFRNKVLGAFALISGISYMGYLFPESIHNNTWLMILFRGPYEILAPVLLYIYIAVLVEPKKNLYKHMYFPIGYIVFMKILVVYFNAYYQAYISDWNVLIHFVLLPVFFLYYFVKGIKKIRALKTSLKQKALQKFTLFYYTFNIVYLSCAVISCVGIVVIMSYAKGDTALMKKQYITLVDATIVFSLIVDLMLLLYMLTETKILTKLYVANLFEPRYSITQKSEIAGRLEKLMEEKKSYLNPDLNLYELSKTSNLNPKLISNYLKQEKGISVNEYINAYRVKEFEYLIREEKYRNYDVFSVAQEVGFNSRATFYRVFKKKTGTSPRCYIEQKLYVDIDYNEVNHTCSR